MAEDSLAPLRWQGAQLAVLDQRALPEREHWIACRSAADVADAIATMAVRGAPAIGLAGAYGLALAAAAGENLDAAAGRLHAARPTAVHLAWALAAMRPPGGATDAASMAARAQQLHREDAAINRRMAERGAALLPPHSRVMTHCNTGALATGGWGTALGVIRIAHAQGRIAEVLAGETRPWRQGARLTAWELGQAGVPCRIIADGAAAWAMQRLRPSWVLVGADRIAANGDTANKIGTYALAVQARALGLKLMVVAPLATIDWTLTDGAGIPIEERAASELAPAGARAWNPVFDVTPAHLIDAIVTEAGVVRAPDRQRLAALRPTTGAAS